MRPIRLRISYLGARDFIDQSQYGTGEIRAQKASVERETSDRSLTEGMAGYTIKVTLRKGLLSELSE